MQTSYAGRHILLGAPLGESGSETRNHLELLKSIPLTIDTDINTVVQFSTKADDGAECADSFRRRVELN